MTPEDRAEISHLIVGDSICLAPAAPATPDWLVRAVDERFVILSRPSDHEPGEIYTIADLVRGVRGPCDLARGGWDMSSPTWADELLRALNYELHVEGLLSDGVSTVVLEEEAVQVSHRNNVPLALATPSERKDAR